MCGWIICHLELNEIPTFNKLNGMCGTNTCTGLTVRAIGSPSGKVWLNGVERTNLYTLVAVDARVLNFAIGPTQ